MDRLIGIVLCLVVAASVPSDAIAQQSNANFKILRIIVGFSTGGGYDTYARVLARHMGRHLAGQPTIIVQNMPGGASLKAIQYLDNGAPTDGSVITAFNPGTITDGFVNPGRQRFDFTQVAWIGSITRDQRVCYAWSTTGIKTLDDLRTYRQFNMGAPTRGTSSFINSAMLKNMFGVNVHHVMGYAGSAEQRLAIERGELDGDCGAWSSIPPEWITDRKINPIVRFAPGPIAGLPDDVPFAGEVLGSTVSGEANDKEAISTRDARDILEMLTAPDLLGRPFVVSKKIPTERLVALRNAFDATMTDAQFLAETEKMGLPVVGPIGGREADRIVASLYTASPALIRRAQDIVGR